MDENLVPVFVMLFVFGFPVAAFIVTRVLRHQERMELLRRGIIPPPDFSDKRARRAWQQSGAPWPPQGTTTVVPPQGAWCAPEDDPQRALFKGIRTAAIGLALLIGLAFIGGTPGSMNFRGGPWLLGGLIPMFVGIAQVIIALLSGAQLPGVQPRVTFGPPPQPPPGGTPPPNFGANGAPWQQPQQPGRSRFEELSKPAPPPDTR
ncbi:MAG: DUF6249 domain-containing protein [Candidatus Elarobacter sp.]